MAAKTKTAHGLRSPMIGCTPTVKTPSMNGSNGNVIKGSAPGKGAPIKSPNNGPKNVGK